MSEDLEFNKLDIHYAGVRSERPICEIEDAELQAFVAKCCSAPGWPPPLQLAFQSSPAVGSTKRCFNPWLDPTKLPKSGPAIARRNVAVIEDKDDANANANANANGQDGETDPGGQCEDDDDTDTAAAAATDWATQHERNLDALPLTDGGTLTTEILLHTKLKTDRLRWIHAKCTNVEPKDVPKHKKKEGARTIYQQKMVDAIMAVQ